MRYAIVSDIHANWQAWSAVRADVRKRGVDTMVCLGDIVGYGPSPTRVFADLVASCDNFVLGNHDAAAAGGLDPTTFNENARRSAEWTAAQFDRASLKRLGGAPLVLEDEDILFVHAETPAPDEFGYVETEDDARACFEATDKRFTFIGHTHKPLVFALAPDGTISINMGPVVVAEPGFRYLVNVGSVGDPGDGTDQASYCVFDSRVGEIALKKVAFDVAAFRAELEKVPELTLPWFLQQHEGESARPVYDQAVAAGKVAGSRIRVPSSRAKIQIKASALATHAGDTLRVANEVAKTPAKKPKRSKTGLIVGSICVATAGALAAIYFASSKRSAPAQPMMAGATAPMAASAVATQAATDAMSVLPAFRAVASREELGGGKTNVAALAVDGDPATRWCSGDALNGHWLQLDLGSPLELGGLKIGWELPGLVYGYKIESSADTRRWTVLAEGSGTDTNFIRLATRTANLRITVTTLPVAKWASIAEVTFFDAAGRAIKTAPPSPTEVESPTQRGRLVVVSATYGVPGDANRTRDVRDKLQAIIDGGAQQFTVADLAKDDDPAHRVVKTLVAECTLGDQRIKLTGQDNQRIALPTGQAGSNEPTAPVEAASTAPAKTLGDALGKVSEAKDYRLVLDLDLAKLGRNPDYAVNETANAPRFDRVAYLVELKKAKEPAYFVWVSMDAFTDDATKLGVPTYESGVQFQQPVENITVVSDKPGVVTGEKLGAGNIEFWPQNYSEKNSARVPGATEGQYDHGDAPSGGRAIGYGSMQVHNPAAKATLFSINNWKSGNNADLGIGRNPGKNNDWTFSGNAHYYAAKRLRVFIRPVP